MKKILLASVATFTLTVAAHSADMAPAPMDDGWAGWYAGVNLGYGVEVGNFDIFTTI